MTGEKLTFIAYTDNGQINDYNLSIDRIDSNKGYTIDNIQLVGAIINIMKNDMLEKDFFFVSTIAINSILDFRDKGQIMFLSNTTKLNTLKIDF